MNKNAWSIGLTYVGAVVGAGFASGQEVWQFFGKYGSFGLLGIAIGSVLFFFLGYLTLETGRSHINGIKSLADLIYPPWFGDFLAAISLAFLVVSLGLMLSGAATLGSSWLGGPKIVYSGLTLMAILLIVYGGATWVVRINTILIPYLLIVTLVIAVNFIGRYPVHKGPVHGSLWFLSALLYVSYNIFTGILVLLGLGDQLHGKRDSLLAAGVGAAILGLLLFLEHRILVALSVIGQLPMVDAARLAHEKLGHLYGISLWVALFTTGIAVVYALAQRLGNWWLFPALAVGLLVSFGRFDTLIALLYPVIGILGLILWVPLVYPHPIKEDRHL